MTPSFDLFHFWNQGDFVTKTIALLLLGMSIASWVVIVFKTLNLLSQRRSLRHARSFWQSQDLNARLDELSRDLPGANPFSQLAREASANASSAHPGSRDWLERRLKNITDDHSASLQSGLAVLASVGSTAPFVGLLGTVWGIHHALLVIGAQGQVSIGQVAGPIGEALIMTALGLAVAIPAVLGYNALVRASRTRTQQVGRFAHNLHVFLAQGAPAGKQATPGPSAAIAVAI
jgi:biopolymer transport protein ExbB